MSSSFGAEIDNLRKESRLLLTSLEKKAKVVGEEVKKLRRRYSSPPRSSKKRRSIYERRSDVWKLRNGSSGVEAALCPDYFRLASKYESASAPDMNTHRVLIKSGRKQTKSPTFRKVIKECYCHTPTTETRKMHYRSARTKHKPLTPESAPNLHNNRYNICGDGAAFSPSSDSALSHPEVEATAKKIQVSTDHGDQTYDSIYSPALSSATLKRAQRIDYTPRSQFLQRVQNKINDLQRSPTRNQVASSFRSLSPLSRFCTDQEHASAKVTAGPISSKLARKHDSPCKNMSNPVRIDSMQRSKNQCVQNEEQKVSKLVLPKKTICSKKPTVDRRKLESRIHRPASGPPLATNRIIRINRRENTCCRCYKRKEGDESKRINGTIDACECCCRRTSTRAKDECVLRNTRDKRISNAKKLSSSRKEDTAKLCRCLQYGDGMCNGKKHDDEFVDDELNEIRKFRDINYFDTHASSPSLLAARSSSFVQQFGINERLFLEPIGTIPRGDLVVTIPPCATHQKRGIHYFPKNVVTQEKASRNTNNTYKHKRRCQSCPLTGHSVDLGALKVDHPPNSLALRFQKGIP